MLYMYLKLRDYVEIKIEILYHHLSEEFDRL